MVGAIIGKGGAKINEIRQLSGSVIKINEPQDNSNERLVTITGTQECNQMALYMLYSRLGMSKYCSSLSQNTVKLMRYFHYREREAQDLINKTETNKTGAHGDSRRKRGFGNGAWFFFQLYLLPYQHLWNRFFFLN